MNVRVKRPTDLQVQGNYEVEDGSAIGIETLGLKSRLSELESLLTPRSTVVLFRDWEGTARALIDGDDRFDVLCILDDGRVGYGGVNQPAFYPTVAAYLEAEGDE